MATCKRGRPPPPDRSNAPDLTLGAEVWCIVTRASDDRPVGVCRGRVRAPPDFGADRWLVLVTAADGPCSALVGTELAITREHVYDCHNPTERSAFVAMTREAWSK